MAEQALQAADCLIEMSQSVVGIGRVGVERDSGPGHVLGGLGAERREGEDTLGPFRRGRGSGRQSLFARHRVPPSDVRRGGTLAPALKVRSQDYGCRAIRVKALLRAHPRALALSVDFGARPAYKALP